MDKKKKPNDAEFGDENDVGWADSEQPGGSLFSSGYFLYSSTRRYGNMEICNITSAR